MEEIWKDVDGYEHLYQVSNTGKIRNKSKQLSPTICSDGYARVILSKHGVRKIHYVHRMVATAFLPNDSVLPVVNHKDQDRSNNSVDNLEWCEQRYNATYADAVQKRSRAVQMIDPNTNIVLKTFYGVREAARETGLHFPNIIQACNGIYRTSGGYKWRYAKEV
jgi:hypothetical protein